MKYLTLEHLGTLPTPRLLTYYKIVRRKIRRHQNDLYCPCCGAPNYTIDAKCYTKEENKKRKEEFETDLQDSENYLKSIKTLLNTREHVKRK
jgi:uncharacterized Zn finger protein (UPF0148 family)